MKSSFVSTAVALALGAAALVAPCSPVLGKAQAHGLSGIAGGVPAELKQEHAPATAMFGLPAGLGLISAISAGLVQSVEKVAITIGASASSNTATISSVDTSRTSLVWGGQVTSNTTTEDASLDMGTVTLTNATTVTANRNSAGATTLTVYATVVQWRSSAVQSVQFGTLTLTTTQASNTATISSVTTTNAAVFFLGNYNALTGVLRNAANCILDLTNATTVTATRNTGTSTTVVCRFCVVEFKTGILNSNTQKVAFSESTLDSNTATITAVTVGQTMLAYGGQTGQYSSSMNGSYIARVYLSSTTTVTYERASAGAGQININCTVVEFKAASIQNVQRGNSTSVLDGNTQADTTITSVNTAKAFYSYLGMIQSSGSGAQGSRCEAGGELQSATNVRQYLGPDVGAIEVAPSWEVIEFK